MDSLYLFRKGRGTFYNLNGDRYVGEWNRDMPDGKGTYYFTNGDRSGQALRMLQIKKLQI